MRPVALIAATVVLFESLAAYAHSREPAVAPPSDRSTGPTISDNRSVEQNAPLPSTSGGMTSPKPADLSHGNWCLSDGLNSDPNNPSGSPGPATGLGISPTR